MGSSTPSQASSGASRVAARPQPGRSLPGQLAWLPDPDGGEVTVEGRRAAGLRRWLEAFEREPGDPATAMAWRQRGTAATGPNATEALWVRFRTDKEHPVDEDVLAAAVDYLDSFCLRDVEAVATAASEGPAPPEAGGGHGPSPPGAGEGPAGGNVFEAHLERCATLSRDEVAKQLRFQRALLDVKDVLQRLRITFFLCCGTALGAVREGYFIPHDDDIDLGIFAEDLSRRSGGAGESVAAGGAPVADVDAGQLQTRLIELLSELAIDGRFVCFDVCGEVTKGLELRLLHQATRVPVDLNLFYPMLPSDRSPADASAPAPFVWFATYYEHAASRLHGMYRYRHQPFRSELRRVRFCDIVEPGPSGDASGQDAGSTTSTAGFLVPPERYFIEYFGDDWRVPKKYTYADGLRGEYRNIIPE